MSGTKMNVLFIIVQMDIMGGSERLVYQLIDRIDRSLFNPSLAWFYGDRKRKDFRSLGIGLYHIPKTRRFDFETMRRMAALIEEKDIHVVNAHHFLSLIYAFYGCKIRDRAGLVYTEHSAWEIDRISAPWRKIGRQVLARADAAVGVSAAVSERIRTAFRVDPAKVTTIPNGVDLEVFGSRREARMLRRRLGLAESDLVVGMLANLKKVKNHMFLLRALTAMAADMKSVKLVLIGQGTPDDPESTEQELRRFVADHGLADRILFLGYRTDIPALLSVMDLFCLTSLQEGLPVSLIEAMAAGLPVIGTDVPGIRDVIEPGRNGFLVKLGDGDGLEKKMRLLLCDRATRAAFGRESKAIASRRYSLSACVARYEDLLLASRKDEDDARESPEERAAAM